MEKRGDTKSGDIRERERERERERKKKRGEDKGVDKEETIYSTAPFASISN